MEGIVCVDVGWIHSVQDKSDWRSLTNMAKSILIPKSQVFLDQLFRMNFAPRT
jgi:hypothetical protein